MEMKRSEAGYGSVGAFIALVAVAAVALCVKFNQRRVGCELVSDRSAAR